jgi:DNA-binding transcriptional ArsR family regulator
MRDLATLPTGGDADIAALGSLIADPARCKVLLAVDDGRALPASVLAEEAGVSRPTASSHLGKLTAAGLLSVETPWAARLRSARTEMGRRPLEDRSATPTMRRANPATASDYPPAEGPWSGTAWTGPSSDITWPVGWAGPSSTVSWPPAGSSAPRAAGFGIDWG